MRPSFLDAVPTPRVWGRYSQQIHDTLDAVIDDVLHCFRMVIEPGHRGGQNRAHFGESRHGTEMAEVQRRLANQGDYSAREWTRVTRGGHSLKRNSHL